MAFVMQAMQGSGPGNGPGYAAKDFNFPVEVADGRRLTISWNRGDDPQQVALRFAQQHGGIGAAELPDIANFVQQASGPGSGPASFQQAPAAPAARVTPAMQRQLVDQVTSMGFPDAMARSALEASNWDIESAISRLLG